MQKNIQQLISMTVDKQRRQASKESDNWQEFDIYSEVTDKGQSAQSYRWVSTEKTVKDGIYQVQARLVARKLDENLK